MTRIILTAVTCLATFSILAGCSQKAEETTTSQPGASTGAVDDSRFLLADEPAGASDVIEVRANASDGDDVVIMGRIGGSPNPFIDGSAAFSIVDGSLKACSDIPGDMCPQPWDYCCETAKLPTATALVKVVDEQGALVASDARQLLQVRELSTVVVKGTAQRDEEGNLTVLADGVHVKQE